MEHLTEKFLAELNKRDEALQQQNDDHRELIKQDQDFNQKLLNRIEELEAGSGPGSSSSGSSSIAADALRSSGDSSLASSLSSDGGFSEK